MDTSKIATFLTPISKAWQEDSVKTASGKPARFFEVAVSGTKEDRDGEVMDQQAISDMIKQFKSGTINFFPDHGMDSSGNRTYSWKQIMGKWIDARQDGDKLIAVAQLNNANPDAELFWGYMQEGMGLGFSIGAQAIEVVEE
jgi:hypothetical protein